MTQEELDGILLDWQKRLRLQDWRINARIVPRHLMGVALGETIRNRRKKTASIRLAEGLGTHHEGVTDAEFPLTTERCLVHELLHLTFAGFDDSDVLSDADPRYIAIEEAINMVADALVDAKEGNGHAVEEAMHEELPTPVQRRKVS